MPKSLRVMPNYATTTNPLFIPVKIYISFKNETYIKRILSSEKPSAERAYINPFIYDVLS